MTADQTDEAPAVWWSPSRDALIVAQRHGGCWDVFTSSNTCWDATDEVSAPFNDAVLLVAAAVPEAGAREAQRDEERQQRTTFLAERIAGGEHTAASIIESEGFQTTVTAEEKVKYFRAELAYRNRLYGQASATIGQQRDLIARLRMEAEVLQRQRAEAYAERDRIRSLWPLNGFGDDLNVVGLVDNHRRWMVQAREQRDVLSGLLRGMARRVGTERRAARRAHLDRMAVRDAVSRSPGGTAEPPEWFDDLRAMARTWRSDGRRDCGLDLDAYLDKCQDAGFAAGSSAATDTEPHRARRGDDVETDGTISGAEALRLPVRSVVAWTGGAAGSFRIDHLRVHHGDGWLPAVSSDARYRVIFTPNACEGSYCCSEEARDA